MQCYVGSKPQDHHIGPINQVRNIIFLYLKKNKVRYASEGNIYVSCSKDGSIKLWDTVTNKVINTIAKAHSGFEVIEIIIFFF